MKNILFVIIEVGIMLFFCFISLYAVKKTAKPERKAKEVKNVLSGWKAALYFFIAFGTTVTSYYQDNSDLLFLNVIIVAASFLEALSNVVEYKETKN